VAFNAICSERSPHEIFILRQRTGAPGLLDEACILLDRFGYRGVPDFCDGVSGLQWSNGVVVFQFGGRWHHAGSGTELVGLLSSFPVPPSDASSVEAACRLLPPVGTSHEADELLAHYLGTWASNMDTHRVLELLDWREAPFRRMADLNLRLTVDGRLRDVVGVLGRMAPAIRVQVVDVLQRFLDRASESDSRHGMTAGIRLVLTERGYGSTSFEKSAVEEDNMASIGETESGVVDE
jgi:hypothetical protein